MAAPKITEKFVASGAAAPLAPTELPPPATPEGASAADLRALAAARDREQAREDYAWFRARKAERNARAAARAEAARAEEGSGAANRLEAARAAAAKAAARLAKLEAAVAA